jgi:EF-hand domain pair/EF hand
MKKLPIIAGASAILVAAAVYAAPAMQPAKADADGNGVITKTEAMAKADAIFAKMDVNGDGIVNAGDREAKVKQHFAEMDTDKNGSINEAEFVAAHTRMAEHRGDQPRIGMEQGSDSERGMGGHRGGKGHHSGMAMMKAADTNNDQAVSRAEFRAAAQIRFAKADTNNDGSISAEEHQTGRKMMRDAYRGHHGHDGPDGPDKAAPDAQAEG